MKQRDLEENDEGMLMCVRVHNKTQDRNYTRANRTLMRMVDQSRAAIKKHTHIQFSELANRVGGLLILFFLYRGNGTHSAALSPLSFWG